MDCTMLIGRLRHPASVWTQIAAATNPADPMHWLKDRFTEHPKRQFIHARTFDNALLPVTTSTAWTTWRRDQLPMQASRLGPFGR